MVTTDFELNDSEWTVIAVGPTISSVYLEVAGRPIFYRIDSSLPTSEIGHRLDSDTHGSSVTLEAGESLYARSENDTSKAIATGE